MRPTRVKVIYVTGLGHSGSTLLGALLGQLDGFFFVGELASKPQTLLEQSRRCGCGELISACPTWRAILADAFPEEGGLATLAELTLDPVEGRIRGMLRQSQRPRRLFPPSPKLERRRVALSVVLRAIAETTGSRVVVDSSKWPGYGRLLQQTEGVELSVLHLVRNPRAVVNSRLRSAVRNSRPPAEAPASFALIWDAWNTAIELAWRRGAYFQLRYEDFVSRPEEALLHAAALAGERPVRLPFVAADRVELAPTHSVAGSRNRFQIGEVQIGLDDEWRTAERLTLGAADRLAVAALTWPLRARYGYVRSPRLRVPV